MSALSEAYAEATATAGRCAIESGAIGSLVDNECEHERLPGDPPQPDCKCWPSENARAARLAAADQMFRAKRPAPILRALDRDRPPRPRKRSPRKVAAAEGRANLRARIEAVGAMPAAECMPAILAALDQLDAEAVAA